VENNKTVKNERINRNRKLKISTAPTKAKSREPACSQAFHRIREGEGSGGLVE